jgi:hypothetical protein
MRDFKDGIQCFAQYSTFNGSTAASGDKVAVVCADIAYRMDGTWTVIRDSK